MTFPRNYFLPFILIFLFTLQVCAQHTAFSDTYRAGDQLYIHARNGLSLRESPDLKSKVLTVVKAGEKVKVLPITQQAPVTNSGIKGVWVKVAYAALEGYQFSGFLSRYPIGNGDQPDSYLKSLFQVKATKTTPPDSRVYNMYEELYFSNTIIFVWSAPEGGSDEMITFPESLFTFQEVYLMMKEIAPSFFENEKCNYLEGSIDCSGENTTLQISYKPAGNTFHPVPSIEVSMGFAD